MVDTASDQIALNQMGDIRVGNHELMAGYLNPYMGLSLVSQGILSKYEGWSFWESDGELQVATPVDEFEAEMHGPLAFWPSEDIIQELTKTQDTIMAAVQQVEQDPEPASKAQSAADPDPSPKDRDGLETVAPIPIDQLETDQEHSNPRSDGAEDLVDHLPLQKQWPAAPQGANPNPSLMAVKPPEKEIELEDGRIPKDTRTPEYAEHCRNGHPYDPDCMVCNQRYMRSKMAMRSPGVIAASLMG